jgi:hypothetical protein
LSYSLSKINIKAQNIPPSNILLSPPKNNPVKNPKTIIIKTSNNLNIFVFIPFFGFYVYNNIEKLKGKRWY